MEKILEIEEYGLESGLQKTDEGIKIWAVCKPCNHGFHWTYELREVLRILGVTLKDCEAALWDEVDHDTPLSG